jgi:hypothetical protein
MITNDPTIHDHEYREAVACANDLQRQLGAMNKDNPRREQLKADLAAAVDAVRTAKEAQKRALQLRVFAGLTSPLHEAVAARLDPAVAAELEADAIARQAERDRRGVERRAAKAAAAAATPIPVTQAVATPPPPLPRTHQEPEIYRALPRSLPSPRAVSAPPTPRPSPPARPPSRGREVADAFREAGRR